MQEFMQLKNCYLVRRYSLPFMGCNRADKKANRKLRRRHDDDASIWLYYLLYFQYSVSAFNRLELPLVV